MASQIITLATVFLGLVIESSMALSAYDRGHMSLGIRANAKFSAVKVSKQARGRDSIEVYIESKAGRPRWQLEWANDGGDPEFSNESFRRDNEFSIFEPVNGSFRIAKRGEILDSSDLLMDEKNATTIGEWKIDDPDSGFVKLKGENSGVWEYLQVTNDGGHRYRSNHTDCSGNKCEFRIIIHKIRWQSSSTAQSDDEDHDDESHADEEDDAGSGGYEESPVLSEASSVHSANSANDTFAYKVWIISSRGRKELELDAAGGYEMADNTFADGATFELEDAGKGDDVFLLKDKDDAYVTCEPGTDEVVEGSATDNHNEWKLVRLGDGEVAIESLTSPGYFMRDGRGGKLECEHVGGPEWWLSDDEVVEKRKRRFQFFIQLHGFA